MPDFAPCPFCGSLRIEIVTRFEEIGEENYDEFFRCGCEECGSLGPERPPANRGGRFSLATGAWQKRASDVTTIRDVAAVAEKIRRLEYALEHRYRKADAQDDLREIKQQLAELIRP